MRHMRAVVESNSAPAERVVLDVKVEARVVVVLVEGVEAVVVTCCAVGDVPWCGGVFKHDRLLTPLAIGARRS